MVIFQIHSTSAENVQVQALNKDVKENTVSGNNTKLNQLAPQYSNELVAYNQLLPYIYSKLPIPVSLINQLRKYNINKNMLNKIHSYNRLRRELHSKLIENEISGYKYNDILSKKLQNLFKSVNQEEKKNFLNLINYLKMFNFDNNKLYNTLHDGNDLFKLINDNKIKYLPFMNSDKMLPDIFTNNKVNKEIKRILIQYKISSKDLYNKLINKINPVLLKDMNKNSAVADPEQKVQIKNVEANNPYELLKERIEDLTSFNKKPRILPLNKELPKAKVSKNINIQQVNTEQKKLIDGSLDKYIKELKLLNEIEKEKDQLCNTKIEDLINPKKNTNEQKTALLQPNPNAALLALYMVLSIPGILSALPDKTKKLPYIRKSKEDILQHSHIEAGKLYSYLMNKNVKESLKKIHAEMKKEKHRNKQEGLNINEFHGEKEALDNKKNPVAKNPMKSRYHPFGHQHSHVLVDDNYYDAPQLPQYEMNPLKDEKSLKINAHELYSALQGRNKLASNKLSVHGKHENAQEKHVDFKIGGKQLFAHLQGLQNNSPKDQLNKQNVDHKIDGKILFDRLAKSEKNKGGWKEDTIYSKKSDNAKQLLHNEMNVNEHEGGLIDGRILFNLLKDKQSGVNRQRVMNKIKNDETNRIKGQDLFDLLDPSRQYMYKAPTGAKYGEPKVNMNKFYEKLYREFMKDNNGILNAMNSKTNQNKAVWHDQNLEIPNISAIDMNEISKQNVVKAEHDNNEQEPNGAP